MVDFYLGELEHCDNDDKPRSDYDSLKFVREEYDANKGDLDCGLVFSRYEEHGPDMYETGYTTEGVFYVTPYEVKTLSRKFDRHYQTTVAGRNGKCRYCVTASTQEEFENDTTPIPKWLSGSACRTSC